MAASIASGAAAEGSRVELVGKVGDDPAGDAVVLALARQRVGHVAMLRDPGRPTIVVPTPTDEPPDPDAPAGPRSASDPAIAADGPVLDAADAGLALRYLPEIAVVVAVHVDSDVLREAIAAAGWTDTTLLVVVPADGATPDDIPPHTVTLAVDDDDDSAAGAAIGRYAAALDRGAPAREAYDALIAAVST